MLEREGKGLVELVEAAQTDSKETLDLLKKYVQPMLEQNIDCLVLGCTHYPYLVPMLKEWLPKDITIIDSGEAVARQTKAILEKDQLLSEGVNNVQHIFYSNGNIDVLKNLVRGPKVEVAHLDF